MRTSSSETSRRSLSSFHSFQRVAYNAITPDRCVLKVLAQFIDGTNRGPTLSSLSSLLACPALSPFSVPTPFIETARPITDLYYASDSSSILLLIASERKSSPPASTGAGAGCISSAIVIFRARISVLRCRVCSSPVSLTLPAYLSGYFGHVKRPKRTKGALAPCHAVMHACGRAGERASDGNNQAISCACSISARYHPSPDRGYASFGPGGLALSWLSNHCRSSTLPQHLDSPAQLGKLMVGGLM